MDTDHKEFLKPELDFKLVHYIEKQARHGHTMDEVRKDLMRVGRTNKEIDKYIEYVETHRGKINLHGNYMQMVLFGTGLLVLLIGGAAVYYFLR